MACWAELRKPFLLDSSPFVEVDRERLSDPYYLSLSRHFQTLAIAQAKRGLWGLENTLRKVEATGLLFPREIKMCLEDDFVLPLPWHPNWTEHRWPSQFDGSLVGLNYITVPDLLEDGVNLGILTGVWDMLTLNHLRFIREAKARCELLMVGVDRNHFVQRNKGETRPINDFPVRVGTLNGISEIDIIFPCNVDEIAMELYFGEQAYNVSEFVFGPLFGLSFFLSPESLSLLSDPQERERVITGLKQEHGLFYGFPGKVTLFISETDPHREIKTISAEVIGWQLEELPSYGGPHSTDLIEKFNLKQQSLGAYFPPIDHRHPQYMVKEILKIIRE